MLKRFLRDESGVTAIEYGLIASLIFLVIIAGVSSLGTNVSGLFEMVANSMSGAGGG